MAGLDELLDNLIDNTARYSGRAGAILCQAAVRRGDISLIHTLACNGDRDVRDRARGATGVDEHTVDISITRNADLDADEIARLVPAFNDIALTTIAGKAHNSRLVDAILDRLDGNRRYTAATAAATSGRLDVAATAAALQIVAAGTDTRERELSATTAHVAAIEAHRGKAEQLIGELDDTSIDTIARMDPRRWSPPTSHNEPDPRPTVATLAALIGRLNQRGHSEFAEQLRSGTGPDPVQHPATRAANLRARAAASTIDNDDIAALLDELDGGAPDTARVAATALANHRIDATTRAKFVTHSTSVAEHAVAAGLTDTRDAAALLAVSDTIGLLESCPQHPAELAAALADTDTDSGALARIFCDTIYSADVHTAAQIVAELPVEVLPGLPAAATVAAIDELLGAHDNRWDTLLTLAADAHQITVGELTTTVAHLHDDTLVR